MRREYGSNIPLARDLLKEIAHVAPLGIARRMLNDVLPLMTRSKAIKSAPCRAKGVNYELARAVKRYADLHCKTPNRDIGRKFGIDGGRVSEIMNSKDLKRDYGP